METSYDLRGRADEALLSHRTALTLNPTSAEAHNSLANALLDSEQFNEAIAEYVNAIHLCPNVSLFHINLGGALDRANRFAEARMAYEHAIKLDPQSIAARTGLGYVLLELNDYESAIAIQRAAIELAPNRGKSHESLGEALRASGDIKNAEIHFRRAIEIDPASATAWTGLGTVQRATGHFDSALSSFKRSLELDPNNAVTHNFIVSTGRRPADVEIERLARLLDNAGLSRKERVPIHFALGKLLDESDRFDEAFAQYVQANWEFKSLSNAEGNYFDRDRLHRQIDALIEVFTQDYFAARGKWGSRSDLPVFVIGMPRSGTTLVEQISATHSHVFGAGELPDLYSISAKLGVPNSWEPEGVTKSADEYLKKIASLGGASNRVIDKMPGNIFNLGLIATLFPNAKVIYCMRDARDNCLSCFFQWFAKSHLMFSYDLADCAVQFLEQERLMSEWRRALPISILPVQYEELVADLEGQSQRLIEFIGLEWEPECLSFHKTERAVMTSSAWQVRQPLYNSSVGRWRNYEKHLGPLFQALEAGRNL